MNDALHATGPLAGGEPQPAPNAGVPDAREWNAASYHRVSGPQQRWAAEQFERLELRGDEVLLDAGCGSGKVTELLLERVPRGRVYAVDASAAMVAHARELLGDRATVLCQDLVKLSLPEPVDAVFSNATFHWIPDHEQLFAALAANMKPGAQLVAQCGGQGNIDGLRRLASEVMGEPPFADHFIGWDGVWTYHDAESTAARLRDAGFDPVKTWLSQAPTVPEQPREFLQTVCLLPYLDRLDGELRDRFVDTVLARAGTPLTLGYVRLNIVARKAAAAGHQPIH